MKIGKYLLVIILITCQTLFASSKVNKNIFLGIANGFKLAISGGISFTPFAAVLGFFSGLHSYDSDKKERYLKELISINRRIEKELSIIKNDMNNRDEIYIENIKNNYEEIIKLKKEVKNISSILIEISSNINKINKAINENYLNLQKMIAESKFSEFFLGEKYLNSYYLTKNINDLNLANEYLLRFKTIAETQSFNKFLNKEMYSKCYILLGLVNQEYFKIYNKKGYILKIKQLISEIISNQILNSNEKLILIPSFYYMFFNDFKKENIIYSVNHKIEEFFISLINKFLNENNFYYAIKSASFLSGMIPDRENKKIYDSLMQFEKTGILNSKFIKYRNPEYREICKCFLKKEPSCFQILTKENLIMLNKKYKSEYLAKKSIEYLLNRGDIYSAYKILKNSIITDEYFILKSYLIIYGFIDNNKKNKLKNLILKDKSFPLSLKQWVKANVN